MTVSGETFFKFIPFTESVPQGRRGWPAADQRRMGFNLLGIWGDLKKMTTALLLG